ncbi:MAG: DUF1501 domain-containing protein [Planctomycetaceae bacterium]
MCHAVIRQLGSARRKSERLPEQLAKFDQGITALVEDLHQRGLDQDVSVVAWGEFGRTPRINAGGGRDHWPQVSCGLLAGGGMRMGQVIGSTNRLGEVPQDRPVHYQEVFATLTIDLGLTLKQPQSPIMPVALSISSITAK